MALALGERVAGAPISWGLCEVPGWGYQLDRDRVLGEMRDLGLASTEFGPPGFLDDDPADRRQRLTSFGLSAVGGFYVALLHDPDHDPLPGAAAFIEECVVSGGDRIVLAAHTGVDGYDSRPVLDEVGWATMLANLDRVADHAADRGVVAALHPHIGTMIENGDEVDRVVAGSRVLLCLDTGHLAAAGADPVRVAEMYADRIAHVHLKDVDSRLASQVVDGTISFGAAVKAGMFCPLGAGGVDIAAIVSALESAGYAGYYVLEQDVMLDAEPLDAGPAANVRRSLDYLLSVAP